MGNVYHMPEEDKRNVIELRISMAKLKAQTDFNDGKSLDYKAVNELYGKYSKPARAYINKTLELREKNGHENTL